ncbi:MAG TPA: hypothetical protein VFW90_02110 [Candidatus Saccharimonadales bacterium]|nr:hypothetical protein [Candidatus Saccharimonadales bacterium]
MSVICEGIVMEAGPIKHWWDENWDTPEHWIYDNWREAVSSGLVDANFLVYRPHHAMKGVWDDRAQAINDTALRISDVVLNLTPPGVPSLGTDGEVLYKANFGGLVLPAPPVEDVEQGVQDLIATVKSLDIRREAVEQAVVTDSLELQASHLTKITNFLDSTKDSVLRVHFYDEKGRIEALDAKAVRIKVVLEKLRGGMMEVAPVDLLKIEALG